MGWAYDSDSKSDPMGTNNSGGWGAPKLFKRMSNMENPSDTFAVFHGNWSTFAMTDGHG
jgi:hypothetical protein